MLTTIACSRVVALSLGLARPADAAADAALGELQGAWRLETVETDGAEADQGLFAAW